MICAQCEHFSMKGHPDQAALGMGRCNGFDGHVMPIEPFVRWNAVPCVLFGRAKDIAVRNRWIEKQNANLESEK
jgi:hypothetical protein